MTRSKANPAFEPQNERPRTQAHQIQIVLCGTSHPGNLGAVARAMKNMGLARLVLVAPTAGVDELALATAKHAADVLHNAKVMADLTTALAYSVAVWATTARPRELHLPVWTPRAAAESIAADQQAGEGLISIVFGAERTGLSNFELSWAQRVIEIPANPEYPVLNLGQAVQILAYELYVARQSSSLVPGAIETDINSPLAAQATLAQWQAFEDRLANLLDQTPFFVRGATVASDMADNRARLMSKLRIMCRRARPLSSELAIMQGMLTALSSEPHPEALPRLPTQGNPQ
jgi:TrmH family RNA methyltransferase